MQAFYSCNGVFLHPGISIESEYISTTFFFFYHLIQKFYLANRLSDNKKMGPKSCIVNAFFSPVN